MRDSTRPSSTRQTAWRIVAIGLVVAVVTTACAGGKGDAETSADDIRVTFDRDQCAYDGPSKVTPGQISVILDVEDQTDYEAYGLAVVTLDEDMTFEDLDAWSSVGQPPWAQLHGLLDDIPQGGRSETTIIVPQKPLYLVCFTADPITKVGVLGPVEAAD
jgi:hypothetical protein